MMVNENASERLQEQLDEMLRRRSRLVAYIAIEKASVAHNESELETLDSKIEKYRELLA